MPIALPKVMLVPSTKEGYRGVWVAMVRWTVLLLLSGCASAPTPAPQVADEDDTVLGTVNGKPIYASQIPGEVALELKKTGNEQRQRQYHMLWVGFEKAINASLLEAEAERRGTSVEQLRREEIESKIKVPDDDTLRNIYNMNKDSISVSFEEARDSLRDEFRKQMVEQAEQRFVETLRTDSTVEYTLRPPVLPRYPVDAKGQPTHGPRDAKVTIIIFSDFECPFCKRAQRTLAELKTLFPDQLRIAHRDFPLAQHPNAWPAAEGAECAFEQGKFWPLHDLLYEHASSLSAARIRDLAINAGADGAAYDTCMRSGRAKKAVEEDMSDAQKVEVDGTPTIFINGIKLIGLLPVPLIRAIIQEELSR